jgi:hypothetical protein
MVSLYEMLVEESKLMMGGNEKQYHFGYTHMGRGGLFYIFER